MFEVRDLVVGMGNTDDESTGCTVSCCKPFQTTSGIRLAGSDSSGAELVALQSALDNYLAGRDAQTSSSRRVTLA